ncbi:calcium-binding protein, partial [Stella humosa]
GDIQVFGQDGNDEIYAQNSGSDTLDGGNDDDEIAILNGSVGDKVLIGGFGDDEIDIQDTSGVASQQILPNTQVTVIGGEGDDTVEYDRGLFITDANDGGDGDDHLDFDDQTILTLRDLSIQNFETVLFSDSEDSVVFADGNVAAGKSLVVEAQDGDDYIDGSRETNGTFELYGFFGDDTLIGGAKNDTLIGGEDVDYLVGGAGQDQFVFAYADEFDTPDVLGDFTGTVDQAVFNGNSFGGMSAIDGYKGTTGVGASANDNLLIATGQGYSQLAQFDTFLSEGAADNNKPGFYIFFNTNENRAEMYFDTDMTSTDGALLIATFNNITAVSQLDKLNEGPTGNNSGDFVI